jgi:hypothetical protein
LGRSADDRVVAERLAALQELLPELPTNQRQVVVCAISRACPRTTSPIVGITDGNQRVLLHRGEHIFDSCCRQRWERSDDAIVPATSSPGVPSAVELMADISMVTSRSRIAPPRGSSRGCPHCSEYLAQLRVTIVALGHAEPEDLTDDAVDELVHLYRMWRADS